MKSMVRYFLLLIVSVAFGNRDSFAQNVPQGFSYQTTIRNSSGVAILSQPVGIRFSFYMNSPAGTLVWQEAQSAVTDVYGHIHVIIGGGTSTGAGSLLSFDQINWSTGLYYLKVSIDPVGGTSYTDLGNSQLFSVPYALYSLKTNSINNLQLDQLIDVDVPAPVAGHLLLWNGAFWIPSPDKDSDTVSFVYTAGQSVYSDSAMYVYGGVVPDSTMFAYGSDSSVYSNTSSTTTNSEYSISSDTATYALYSVPYAWTLTGNSMSTSSSYLGTNDNTSFAVKTNNTKRASLTNTGAFAIGSTSNSSSLSIVNDDGFLSTGTFGTLISTVSGAGTKLAWYPALGSFRAGTITAAQWDTANTGEYSMAFGYNTKARDRSFALGYECEALDYSFAAGRKTAALAVGGYPAGNSVTLGDSCIALSYRSVLIGKNNYSTGGINGVIGYNNSTPGNQSIVLGSYCNVTGNRSTVLGYHAATSFLKAGFVYADASSTAATTPLIAYQFVVRASGGVVFYTDSLNTVGVTLFPGGGSWSVVSDRNKKTNISEVDPESILMGIENLKIDTWNYRSQSRSIRHIGPMAQDFNKQFHFGENAITISGVDMDGVILAGIKALNARVDGFREINELELLKNRIEKLNDTAELKKRLDVIEETLLKKN